MLSLLNASMLPALAASLLPLLIHLIHRRRVSELPFSNVAFLMALQEGRLRSFKTRQWLLLLLRTLAIFFLTLAFCRPTVGKDVVSARQGDGETGRAMVLLLDRSYSLGYPLRDRRLFDVMVDKTLALVNGMMAGDAIFLIGFSDRAEPLVNRWLDDPEIAKGFLNHAEMSWGATDIVPALRRAAELLKGAKKVRKELYVFSDLAEHGWRSVEDSLVFDERGVSVFIVPFQREHVRNASIDSVWIEEGIVMRGQQATIMGRVTNRGEEEIGEFPVQLMMNGKKAGVTAIRLNVGETRDVVFPIKTSRETRLTGYVEIADDDLLPDNRRYFSIGVRDSLRVLLSGHQGKDTRFLEDALRASFPQGGLQMTTLQEVSFHQRFLQRADVIVLSNIRSLAIEQVEAIKAFLKGGGGAFICLGDAVDPEFYNTHLFPDILPVRLISPISGTRGDEGVFRFDHFLFTHPVFNGLRGYEEELRRPGSRTIYRIEIPPERARALIGYSNGTPALCEAIRERGRLLFFNSSVDLAGGDFPISGIFSPLLYRVMNYLSFSVLPPYSIGESIERDTGVDEENGVAAVIESPTGDRESLTTIEREGRPVWRIGEVTTPGIWRITGDSRVIDEFPVNVNVRESERGVIGEARLSRIFSGNTVRVLPADGSFDMRVYSQVMELWSACLVAALLMFGLEMVVGYKKMG